jgi:hypothetical protein
MNWRTLASQVGPVRGVVRFKAGLRDYLGAQKLA